MEWPRWPVNIYRGFRAPYPAPAPCYSCWPSNVFLRLFKISTSPTPRIGAGRARRIASSVPPGLLFSRNIADRKPDTVNLCFTSIRIDPLAILGVVVYICYRITIFRSTCEFVFVPKIQFID